MPLRLFGACFGWSAALVMSNTVYPPAPTYVLDKRLGGIWSKTMTMLKSGQRRIKAVSNDQLRSVVFLGAKTEQGFRWGGIGTWVSIEQEGMRSDYLMTAAHVVGSNVQADEDSAVRFRLNLANGESETGVIPGGDWIYGTEEGLDVAVTPVRRQRGWETTAMDTSSFASDEALALYDMGPGDSTLAIGLYPRMLGTKRNSPLVRSGVIAGMPEDAYRSKDGNYNFVPYLVECRSLNGVSGSPVYIRMREDVVGPCQNPDHKHEHPVGTIDTMFLIGIVHGHWDLKASLENDQNGESYQEAVLAVNEGISILTRAQDILDFLESNAALVGARQRAVDAHRDENAATLY